MTPKNLDEIQKNIDLQIKSMPKKFWKKLERECNKTIEYLKSSNDDQISKLIRSVKLIPKVNKPLEPLFSCTQGCSTCCEYNDIIMVHPVQAYFPNQNVDIQLPL